MNILLMGCSWGVPNYSKLKGDPPETHTEFLLRKLGHNVYNCSENGGSNLSTLYRAAKFLNGGYTVNAGGHDFGQMENVPNLKIDLVLWFHTDPGRDIDMISTTDKSISQQLEEICLLTYKNYSLFFEQLKCKIAIVGACADVHPTIKNHIPTDFLLCSWQQELLGISTSFFRIETGLKVPSEEDIMLTENAIKVFDAMNQNKLMFPDGGHPGALAHRGLLRSLREQLANITAV